MNKIHEKYILFRSNSVTFLIPKQSSRWFQLNRDRNYTKFTQISYIYASENIKTIYKTYCAALSFSARERMQPTAVLRTPAWARGPAAIGRAAETARAPLPRGPKTGPLAAGCRWPSIVMDGRACSSAEQNRLRPHPLVTLAPFFSSPPHLSQHTAAAEGFIFPATGDGRRR
jgi:hypothetical protein